MNRPQILASLEAARSEEDPQERKARAITILLMALHPNDDEVLSAVERAIKGRG